MTDNMTGHWKEEDVQAAKEFKKSLDAGVKKIAFKSPEEFIKSLGKVERR